MRVVADDESQGLFVFITCMRCRRAAPELALARSDGGRFWIDESWRAARCRAVRSSSKPARQFELYIKLGTFEKKSGKPAIKDRHDIEGL